ncbi:MAG: ribosome biogenesis GTP-binding protein YihA/YsxC [Pyrinomonadaceae bacterium]
MKIISAEFIKSSFNKLHWPTDGLAEIAFLGRSNVGKSSLINSLLLRKSLARTSNTPGRTQSINFFLINEQFYFADLPGYGYARVSKEMRLDWRKMAEEYLADRDELKLCIQLIDARHGATPLDVQLNEWLEHHGKPHLIVATKSDKLSNNELRKSMASVEKQLTGTKVLAYSAQSGRGREELLAEINAAIKNS